MQYTTALTCQIIKIAMSPVGHTLPLTLHTKQDVHAAHEWQTSVLAPKLFQSLLLSHLNNLSNHDFQLSTRHLFEYGDDH